MWCVPVGIRKGILSVEKRENNLECRRITVAVKPSQRFYYNFQKLDESN